MMQIDPAIAALVARSKADLSKRNTGEMAIGKSPRIKWGAAMVAAPRQLFPKFSATKVTNMDRLPYPYSH
jgi:hypothetical protein